MNYQMFRGKIRAGIESEVKRLLNSHDDFLSPQTVGSTRAVGDAIENIVSGNFEKILGKNCVEYSAAFARRAMADLAFRGRDGTYYMVDVKTHRADAAFSMPQLTSVERLARLYEDDGNVFALLIVKYQISGDSVTAKNVKFLPIESLNWNCLTIGALGWGQIQIADSNKIVIDAAPSRKEWMLNFCDRVLDFYPREIAKIGGRISRFKEVQEFWRNKPNNA